MAREKKKLNKSEFKIHELALSSSLWYDPAELKGMDPKKMRKEYTRMRDIAQKRLKRMGSTIYTSMDIYKYNVNRFKKLKDIKTDRELRQMLSDVSRFVNNEASTLRGQDELLTRRINSLREHINRTQIKYPIPTNKEDAYAFFKFVDWLKDKTGTDYFYDLSSAERRKINTKKIKEMLRQGLYSEAYRKVKNIMDVTEQVQKEKKKMERQGKKAQNKDIMRQVERTKKADRRKRLQDEEETLTEDDIKGFDRYYRNR